MKFGFHDGTKVVWPRFLIYAGLAMLASPVIVIPGRAQLLQGSITGNISDPSGAAIGDAKVVVTNQQTNFSRDAVTNSSGGYNIPTLPSGAYTITVTAAGFQTSSVTGVIVSPEEVTRRDVSLTVGQLNQNVTVAAEVNNLQTDRADLRDDLNTNLLANAPVPIGRNYEMLFQTIPGVSPPQNSNSFTANSNRGLTFTVNGGATGTNSIRVDGTGTFDMTALAVAQFIPGLEAIENVSVSGNSFDAEQSAGSGAVNITVKSGTNQIHGVLFEDHTDNRLKAYPWAANRFAPEPKYIDNQFGGTIGGPIKKDKLFYFVSFEGTGYSQDATIVGEVPNAVMRTGNLSASPTPIYDPATGNPTGTGRTAFPGNIIPLSRIDVGVQALLGTGQWALPNQAGTGSLGLANNYLGLGSTYLRRDQTDTKFTWNPTPKFSMFARMGWGNNYWTTPEMFGPVLGGPNLSATNTAAGQGATNVLNGTISGTYVFTPHLIVDAHFGYDVNDAYSKQFSQAQNLGWSLLQIPGLNTAGESKTQQLQQGGLPTIVIDGYANLGSQSEFQPQAYWDPEKNWDANISWIKGTHNIRGGFDSDFQTSNEMQYQPIATGFTTYISSAGGFHFAQGTTQLNGGPSGNDYNAFASFLLGYPQDSGKVYQFPSQFTTRQDMYAIYIRDQWQVTPKLTFNYGARLDFYPFPGRNGQYSGLPTNMGLEYYNVSNNSMYLCGVGPVPLNCGVTKDRYHVVPRVGLAYRITDSIVIRAGYGIATDPTNVLGYNNRRYNYPYIDGLTILPPNSYSYATTFRQGIPVPTPPNVSTGIIPNVPATAGVNTYDNSDWARGYVQTWNFTVEARLKQHWTATIAYAGLQAIDPTLSINQNYSLIGQGTAGQLENNVTDGFRTASTPVLGTEGSTNYNALQTRVVGRFSGLTLNVGYTWSKNLGFQATPSAIPQYYRQENYGPLPTDIASNLQATLLYELPFGKGKPMLGTGLASKILGGWDLSAIFSDYSGRPFSVVAPSTTLNAVGSSQFADCILPAQQLGKVYEWYNVADFASPSAGRFGTCGNDVLRGPWLVNVDLGLDKKFALTEKIQLMFKVEMFNAGNTPHHANPGATSSTGTTSNNNVTNSAFMQATSIANTGRDGVDERTIRLNMKLTW
jgi:hypothetical protein